MGSDAGKFLGVSFNFYRDSDEKDLNASLHRQLFLLEPYIRGYCESLFNWESLDRDERDEHEPVARTSIWIDLLGISGIFPRKDYPQHFRQFYLEIGYIGDYFSFTIFEDMTEDTDEALERHQQVADADVDISKLGLTARKGYRPQTGDVQRTRDAGIDGL
jgi:hypothetical protein